MALHGVTVSRYLHIKQSVFSILIFTTTYRHVPHVPTRLSATLHIMIFPLSLDIYWLFAISLDCVIFDARFRYAACILVYFRHRFPFDLYFHIYFLFIILYTYYFDFFLHLAFFTALSWVTLLQLFSSHYGIIFFA